MAKRAKGKKGGGAAGGAEQATEAVKPSEVMVLISASTLKKLLQQDDKYKGDIDALVGELRETIGNAVEKKHLDKAAYAMLKKFHRIKSPEKAASLYYTFLAYMDLSGELKRIESVNRLPLGEDDDDGGDGEEAEAPEAETDDVSEGKVARPAFGRQH